MTYDVVQDRLVEAIRLWWRSPGGGRWPFAGDGPWHLVRTEATAEAAWEIARNAHEMGRSTADVHVRRPGLSRAEVAERDRVSEWLLLVPGRDRKLVVLALTCLARGNARVRWSEIRRDLIASGEDPVSARGLGQRYTRAIAAIVRRLNAAENRGVTLSTPGMS